MLIGGLWHPCDDGFVRPVLPGEVLAADGTWKKLLFLVDTGADRTVFSGDCLAGLGLPQEGTDRLGGVGGVVGSVTVTTQIRFTRENGDKILFRGKYAAIPERDALDMSVLGREILNLFAVVVDRPQDVVCLIRSPHTYTVGQG